MVLSYSRLNSLAIFPNNEVRFRSAVNPKSKAGSHDPKHIVMPDLQDFLDERAKANACPHAEGALVSTPKFQETTSPLPPSKPGYGSLPPKWRNFSHAAKRSLSLRGAALERRFKKHQQTFVTATLPGSTDEAKRALAAWSGYLMNRIQVWLFDNYSIDGTLYHLGVWELQKRGALHYHALVVLPLHVDLIVFEKAFKSFWYSMLEQVSSPEKSGVDLFERESGGTWYDYPRQDFIDNVLRADAQRVFKSITAYLSKYLGKNEGKEETNAYCPSRWWACTRAVKNLQHEYTEHHRLPDCTEEQSEELNELFMQLAEAWGADFKCKLFNTYSGKQYGTIAIFNDRKVAMEYFQVTQEIYESALRENQEDIEFYHRYTWEKTLQLAKEKLELETTMAAEEAWTDNCSSASIAQVAMWKAIERLSFVWQKFIGTSVNIAM